MLRLYRRVILVVLILAVLLIGVLWILEERRQLIERTEDARNEYLDMRKEFVKQQTNSVVRYIEGQYDTQEKILKQELRQDVERAMNIADNLYTKKRGEIPEYQLKSIIIEALRDLYQGDEYVFIVRMDGVELLYPTAPEYEGKNLLGLQDARGKYVIQEELEIVRKKGEGFTQGHWIKPGAKDSLQYPKLTFVKKFEHFDWYIGKGKYLDEFQRSLKSNVLQWASRIRYGEQGYVFINSYSGKSLLTNGKVSKKGKKLWDYNDVKGREVFEKELEAIKNPGGDFIYYQWRKLLSDTIAEKVSFVRGFDEWGWIIGCGLYLDEVDTYVASQKEILKKEALNNLLYIGLFVVLVIMLSLMFLHRFSRWIIRDYSNFKDFLRQASNENVEIDEDNLRFSEIRELADTANNLVRTRALATEQMEIEKLYLERLLESAPEGIVVTDKKGYILRVNDRFLAIFKYTQDEVMGKHIDDLIAPEEFRKEADQYTLLVGEGKELSRETIRQTRDKERIYVSILATPIISGKGEEAFYVIYRDITDRKMAEKQLKVAMEKAKESDRLKTAFLSNMSHEIRTPLNAIVGFSELITNTYLEESEKKEYAGLISQNSKMLVTLINDIIDVSKIESGQLQITKKDTNLNDLMKSVYDSFSAYQIQTAKEHIEWIYETDETEHCIKTDPDRLRQILTNLITNAFKFTHKGSVKMSYTLEKGMVRFYIKDTGIGIASEDLKKIFVRFQQADISSTRKYGGTGLGLAISKSLVKLLGGAIHVKSEPNKGSEFVFTLPDEPCTGMQSTQNESTEAKPGRTRTATEELSEKNTILIVEDEDSNFMYLKAVLQPRGYTFIRATRGEKAIETVKNNPGIGMVLMDVQLPDFSGYEATRRIKELKPELPIVAQTAYAMGDEKEKSLEAGCDDYLSKPINKDRLLEIIKRYIS